MSTLDLSRLRRHLETSRPIDGEAAARVAVVGARRAHPDAEAYARALAAEIARAGGIVVSGGAIGVDRAAHEGALSAQGRTWLVAPHGRGPVFPKENEGMFRRVEESAGAIVWPFPRGRKPYGSFKERNGVLVELSDAVVVVQATAIASGTYSAACKALRAGRPLWIVPLPPWIPEADGTLALLRRKDVRALWRTRDLLESVGLAQPRGAAGPAPRSDPHERAVLAALAASGAKLHKDELAASAGLDAASLSVALFALELEGLVRVALDGGVVRAD